MERLEIVDGLELSAEHRALLRPGEEWPLPTGGKGRLPRYFYRVDSWAQARSLKLTVHFTLAELMSVDCRVAPLLLREFPHYVPCSISVLARYLETFRERVDGPVHIAVNGGYRSPAHAFSTRPTLHPWATAANIYRIGEHLLNDEKTIERYGKIAEGIGQEVQAYPYGHGARQTDDHLHLELGLLYWAPA
jgi:hypothetical protein